MGHEPLRLQFLRLFLVSNQHTTTMGAMGSRIGDIWVWNLHWHKQLLV